MDKFWQNNGDKIIVGVVTAIVILILSEPIKALFKKLGKWLETIFQSVGLGFKKRYCCALQENHQWLQLIGIYDRTQLHPPRLQSVYVSLRMAAADADDSPRFPWDRIFSGTRRQMVILGQPGAGKTTLLDYLVLILTGHVPTPTAQAIERTHAHVRPPARPGCTGWPPNCAGGIGIAIQHGSQARAARFL